MTNLKAAVLESRGVVAVAGQPAGQFLQGLVTADMDDLAPKTARNAALLTPQGKILFEFILFADTADRFLLDARSETAGDLAKRLMFYRLRAKIEIEMLAETAVVAYWGGESSPAVAGAFADPRYAELGWRAIVPAGEVEAALAGYERVSEADYQAHRIALGVAELGSDYGSSETFPHEADLDQFGGVDFDKGCFVGQEVVSRMHHRGTARNRFVPVDIDGPTPEPGTKVDIEGKSVGTMGSVSGNRGLARLRLDRVGEAMSAGATIRAGAATLRLVRPGWATFAWPGDDPGDQPDDRPGARTGGAAVKTP